MIQKTYFLKACYFLFVSIGICSCCVFKTDNPDLRIIGQNFPSTARVNQTFGLSFTIGNFSDGDCDAAKTSQCIVNLKMVNRETQYLQVNNNATLNSLDNNANQTINFSVTIGTAATYDLTFIVDPNNNSGEVNHDNNTYTGVVIITN